MIQDQPSGAAHPTIDPEEIAQSGLVPQVGMVSRALWASPARGAHRHLTELSAGTRAKPRCERRTLHLVVDPDARRLAGYVQPKQATEAAAH